MSPYYGFVMVSAELTRRMTSECFWRPPGLSSPFSSVLPDTRQNPFLLVLTPFMSRRTPCPDAAGRFACLLVISDPPLLIIFDLYQTQHLFHYPSLSTCLLHKHEDCQRQRSFSPRPCHPFQCGCLRGELFEEIW